MLIFPQNYFNEEIRDQFTISSTMKRAWAAQLELLVKIIAVCDKHQIQYHATWGTLLGTIRHHGFIPWDDDIDIAMKRSDYIRFLNVAASEFPPEYCILNTYFTEEWLESFTRITNGQTIDISPQRLKSFHGCPFVIGIDIFPLDNIPDNEEEANCQLELLSMLHHTSSLLNTCEAYTANKMQPLPEHEAALEESLAALEAYSQIPIDRHKNIRNQLERLYDKISMLYWQEDCKYMTLFPFYEDHPEYLFKSEWFSEYTLMPFENIQIAVPNGYDETLRTFYGDYMVPVQVQDPNHPYPFYQTQLQELIDRGMWPITDFPD